MGAPVEDDSLALPFSEEYGGAGTGTLVLEMAVEEIAKPCTRRSRRVGINLGINLP